jgi:hypothetical protein
VACLWESNDVVHNDIILYVPHTLCPLHIGLALRRQDAQACKFVRGHRGEANHSSLQPPVFLRHQRRIQCRLIDFYGLILMNPPCHDRVINWDPLLDALRC